MSLGVTDPSGKAAVAGTPIDSTDGDGTPIKSVTNLSSGKRLIRFDNPNNATELRLGPFNATVDASAMSPKIKGYYPGQFSYPKSSLTFEGRMHTEFDNRSVNLSRSGKDHSRLVDGVWATYGDTIYSYWSEGPSKPVPHENSQVVKANPTPTGLTGGWTPHGVETYGGDYPPAYIYFGKTQIWGNSGPAAENYRKWDVLSLHAPPASIASGVSGWTGTPTGVQQQALSYQIIDDDGAQATALYLLNFHDPVEQISDTTSDVSVVVPVYNADGKPVYTPPAVGATHGNVCIERSTGYSTGWSVGGTFDLSAWLKIFSIDVSVEASSNHDVNTGAILGFDVPPGSYAQAMSQEFYTRHHRFFWRYDADGLIPRRTTVSLDPRSPIGEIVPDEGWNDVYKNSSIPFWKGPFVGTAAPPNKANAPILKPPAPSNTYS